jgi:hypothetical protein
MIFEKCRDILLAESELVQKIAALQKIIRNAVEKREWAGFEDNFKAMNVMGSELAALEKEREALFFADEAAPDTQCRTEKAVLPVELAGGDKGCFYAMTAKLPVEQRNELTAIYRSLKLESLGLRMSNETFMNYLAEARTAIADFFEMAFPDRGGKIYTQRGIPFSHDMRSMVLDRRF